ncbi:MAG: class I SAM-dependent methyltransferase [Armatimonadota bacterium]
MEEELYETFYRIENHHWWFLSRKRIIASLLDRWLLLNKGSLVCDIGCGTGSILEHLSARYSACGVDNSRLAVEFCSMRGLTNVFKGTIDDLASQNRRFDLITFFDVIEHIDDDVGVLKTAFTLLRSGGYVFITVPAFQFLWSEHDKINGHKRRYTKRELVRKLQSVGFEVTNISYYNTILFPVAAFSRLVSKALGHPMSELKVPPDVVNKILLTLFSCERFLLRYISFPFGLSIVCAARKPA